MKINNLSSQDSIRVRQEPIEDNMPPLLGQLHPNLDFRIDPLRQNIEQLFGQYTENHTRRTSAFVNAVLVSALLSEAIPPIHPFVDLVKYPVLTYITFPIALVVGDYLM